MSYKEINKCRICDRKKFSDIINLGKHALTGCFIDKQDSIDYTPINLVKCNFCGLVQLKHSADVTKMFGENYGYASALNTSMVNHLKTIYNYIEDLQILNFGDIVLDIGSNDGTFLNFFSLAYKRVGIDPSAVNFIENYKNIKLIIDYFSKELYLQNMGNKKAKVVSSIACFYDLDDPVKFAQDVSDILDDNGVWVIEAAYLPLILNNLCFDGCCAEHLSYYSLRDINHIAAKVGLYIQDVELNMINGGSFRVILGKQTPHYDKIYLIKMYLDFERAFLTEDRFTDFDYKIKKFKRDFIELLISLKNKNVYGLGASTKFNVILQYCNINNSLIKEIGDINPKKFGKYTPGTNISITNEDEVLKKADYLVVGPYHFKENILKQEKIIEYTKRGGKLIFPLPNMEIYPHEL